MFLYQRSQARCYSTELYLTTGALQTLCAKQSSFFPFAVKRGVFYQPSSSVFKYDVCFPLRIRKKVEGCLGVGRKHSSNKNNTKRINVVLIACIIHVIHSVPSLNVVMCVSSCISHSLFCECAPVIVPLCVSLFLFVTTGVTRGKRNWAHVNRNGTHCCDNYCVGYAVVILFNSCSNTECWSVMYAKDVGLL